MSLKKLLACALMALTGAPIAAAEAAEPLGLEEAVMIALEANDPTVARFEESAGALDDRAVADSRLPDPQVRVGMMNWPVDSFRYGQEPMTKLEVGVQQAIPKGRTREHQRLKRNAEAEGERIAQALTELEIGRDVRRAWLDLYYWINARAVVLKSHETVADLVDVVRSFYATGRQSRQDVLRVELELSLLDDRLVEMDRQIERSRFDLARYIGAEQAVRDPAAELPAPAASWSLPGLAEALARHPAIRAFDARIRARDEDVALAKQQYKPGWMVEGAYGARGAGRPDLATLMVRFDVPLFTGKRQDRRLSAARRDRQAAMLDRDGKLLMLRRDLERTFADWTRFGDRIALYEESVLARAGGNAEAAMDGYRNKTSDFAELVRARLSELDLEIALVKLRTDRAKAEADLIFLQGNSQGDRQ